MTESQSETSSFDEDLCGIANLRRFQHNAMAAPFDVFVVHQDAVYAEQAAWAAFEELDRIEGNLSRFIENSDVSRINSLAPGHPLQIGLETFECLQISIEMYKQTNGAFDITFGSLHTGSNLLKLNEDDHTIELQTEGVRIDLGAVGKGYAADKMGQVLRDWGIDTALISAGRSSVLPIGTPAGLPGWPLTLSDPTDYSRLLARIHLSGQALSASGLRKGPHIINPRSGKPAKARLAAWAAAKTAAAADALSTAFMVMSVDKIRAFCSAHPDTAALLVNKKVDGRLLRFGRWDKTDFIYPPSAPPLS
jgi:thiamine biosynthesis lipoprotein